MEQTKTPVGLIAKPHNTIVTTADRESERRIAQAILERHPFVSIIGEEGIYDSSASSRYSLGIDPMFQ